MLVRGPKAIFPVNWFSETSNSCRDDKFPKQSRSEPPKLFTHTIYFQTVKIVLKESFIDDVIIGGWRVVNLL